MTDDEKLDRIIYLIVENSRDKTCDLEVVKSFLFVEGIRISHLELLEILEHLNLKERKKVLDEIAVKRSREYWKKKKAAKNAKKIIDNTGITRREFSE